jgi:hypothetical protein
MTILLLYLQCTAKNKRVKGLGKVVENLVTFPFHFREQISHISTVTPF